MPSNPYVSEISALIIFFVQLYLREQGIKGHVTGEAGGYIVSGERYAPDVAFISREKQPELARQLAELILKRQEKDGSWWDYPLYSYHQPYGTGYALMSLAWCRDVLGK